MQGFRKRVAIMAAGLVLGMPGPIAAHHSAVMFDGSRIVRLDGVVTAVEWTNPHVWLSVRGIGDAAQVWHFELPGPGSIVRNGFSQALLAPGSSLKVDYHPMRDGRRGGLLLGVAFPDGRTLRVGSDPAPAPK